MIAGTHRLSETRNGAIGHPLSTWSASNALVLHVSICLYYIDEGIAIRFRQNYRKPEEGPFSFSSEGTEQPDMDRGAGNANPRGFHASR